MANTGVSGYVKDSEGNPVKVWVHAFDVEVSDAPVPMAGAWTDTSGKYTISYTKWAYGMEHAPDILLRVYDVVGRLLYESVEYSDVSETIFSAPLITIAVADLKGWLVTLLTGSPTLLSQNNLLTPLIDNKRAWEELTKEVKGATVSINSLQLYLDVGKVFTVFVPPIPPGSVTSHSTPIPTTGERFEEEIYNANLRNVSARLVMNDFMAEPYPVDTAGVVEDYFNGKKPNTVEYRRFRMPYNRAMHAKFTIIDGKVVIMNASPLLQEYFDDVTHAIDDARRGSMSFPKNAIKVPVHDVNCSIQGPAVENVEETFALLWWKTGGTGVGVTSHISPTPTAAAPYSIQIIRTLPGGTFFSVPFAIPKGERGILESYLRAIGKAEDFIYLENQYITEPLIPRALLLALIAKPDLRVIILTNNAVDVPRYQGLQTKLIRQFMDDAKKYHVDDRLGVFTLWSHDASSSPQRIIRNYVHSKVGVVDNKWATIGSANLDGVSLSVSQHVTFYYSESDMLEERAVEVNAVVYNGVDNQPLSTVPDDLRRSLWAEHLGISISSAQIMASAIELNGKKWLDLWNAAAKAKVAGLMKAPPTGNPARILEWRGEKDPEEYLYRFGIKPNKDLKIETEIRDFNFSKGDWDK